MADRIVPAPGFAAQGKATRIDPVRPFLARRSEFTPNPGDYLNVMLPGENVRTLVLEQFSDNIMLVEIVSIVLGKGGATQKKGERIAVQRSQDNPFAEEWVPINDRSVREREQREMAMRMAGKQQLVAEPPAPVQRTPVPDIEPTEIAPRPTISAKPAPLPDPPAPETGSGEPAPPADTEEPEHRRVLGPRRSHISRSA